MVALGRRSGRDSYGRILAALASLHGLSACGPRAPIPEAGLDGAGGGHCDGLTGRRLRRLSRREYANVVSDLLGEQAGAVVTATLPDEPLVQGFDNLDSALYVSPSWMEAVSNLASSLAAGADPTALARCPIAGASSICLQAFIQAFASKAYGRPLSADEISRTVAAATVDQDYAASVRSVIELVLQSPQLLYVSELGDPTAAPRPGGTVPLTSYERASQLSFLLTGTRPDATLLSAAASNGLGSPAAVRAEAERLLSTDRGIAELVRFIHGWLDMTPIAEAQKSPAFYPEFTDAIAAAMQQELDAFVDHALDRGNGTISAFMLEVSADPPAALAPIYGPDLLPTGLDPRHRTGVLSLPGLLTVHAADVGSGPVQRGLLVRRQLLCQDIPGPPASAQAVIAAHPIDPTDAATTTRQKFENHVQDPACRGCHDLIDPIGFGLEDMDGLGRFRTTENGQPVDSSGQLTGTDVDGPFEGPAELSLRLANSTSLQSCMATHFFRFAQLRSPDGADACVVDDWAGKFAAGGGRIEDLVLNYVVDRTFSNRKDDR